MNFEKVLTMKFLTVFLVSFLLVFLMVFLPKIGFRFNKMVSPLPAKIDIFDKVEPRLEQVPSHFQLKKSTIPIVSAGSDYEEAGAYGVVDFDSGEVIASKNLDKKLPVASLTKIMTAVVALDLAHPNEIFSVSQNAVLQPPSKMPLHQGEKFSFEKLLDSMLISSANDSAEVIKEGIDQKFGQDIFIRSMNAKAKFLGLKNTHFTTPQGYDDDNNFSTIEDLSMLSHYAITEYPLITEIVSNELKDLTNNGQDVRFYLNNWNGLLGVYPGVYGIKIGNTTEAGVCTIVISEREGKKIMAIVLGADGILNRDLYAAELLDLGFSKSGIAPANITAAQLRAKYARWKFE